MDDLASLAVEQGRKKENGVINAIGPETFRYRSLVKTIGTAIGASRMLVSMPPWLGYGIAQIIGRLVGDVIITKSEIRGLMDDLLYVDTPPTGKTVLSDWARQHASSLGRHYASEMRRRLDRRMDYRPR